MAMRAIMKKIIIFPKIGFMEGGLSRIPARCFSSTVTEDRRDYLNNEATVRDLERILKDGKRSFDECVMDFRCRRRHEINERWENWVVSSRELWMEKNQEEQRRDLDMYWKYLKGYLHRKGVDTSNHGLLLSMKRIEERKGEGTTYEFIIGSPDKGLVSIDRFVLDRGHLPRQSVNGLLFIITSGAFLTYNPITGERSPWIKTNMPGNMGFGFDPQSGEHKVICISRINSDSDVNNQVVEVYTVGKNTWRRIHATPPVAVTYQDPFYVNGGLYWRFRDIDPTILLKFDIFFFFLIGKVLKFDIITEKFRVIPIPRPWDYKMSVTVELTEIDGCITLFDLCMTLWIMHEDADGNIKWTEEILDEPDDWNGKPDLSIVALTGTNLMYLQSEWSDCIFYFNRNTKEYIRFPISPNCDPFQWKRIIQV